MTDDRKAVLLLFGGESSEHEVSLSSARNVYGAIDTHKYAVSLGYIPRNGKGWRLAGSFDDRDGPELMPLLGQKAFSIGKKRLAIDVILPILHGVHGEDGDVQGLANLLHIPCAGPNLLGAAITMDKDVTKRLLRDAGIPVVDWIEWDTADPAPSYVAAVRKLGPVLFVKPSRTGSSVGVTKVKDEDGFMDALLTAGQFDTKVLIERAVAGREIELAVLGNHAPEVTAPGEIIPGDEFYSYDDKYASGSTSQVRVPADVDDETAARLRDYATRAYVATRGHGMARVDFFVTGQGGIYLNEINAIPGFTDISMYPKLWQYDGLSYAGLIDRLIDLACESV